MKTTKNFFRAALDAMIEARSREAARQVAHYHETFNRDDFDGFTR